MKFAKFLPAALAFETSYSEESTVDQEKTLKEVIMKPTQKRSAVGLERFGINMGKLSVTDFTEFDIFMTRERNDFLFQRLPLIKIYICLVYMTIMIPVWQKFENCVDGN